MTTKKITIVLLHSSSTGVSKLIFSTSTERNCQRRAMCLFYNIWNDPTLRGDFVSKNTVPPPHPMFQRKTSRKLLQKFSEIHLWGGCTISLASAPRVPEKSFSEISRKFLGSTSVGGGCTIISLVIRWWYRHADKNQFAKRLSPPKEAWTDSRMASVSRTRSGS